MVRVWYIQPLRRADLGVLRLSERCAPGCLAGSSSQLPELGDADFKRLLSYHCSGAFFTASATQNDFISLISPRILQIATQLFSASLPAFSSFLWGERGHPPPPRGLLSTRLKWQADSPPPPKASHRLGQPPGADQPAEGCPGSRDGAGEAAAPRSA